MCQKSANVCRRSEPVNGSSGFKKQDVARCENELWGANSIARDWIGPDGRKATI